MKFLALLLTLPLTPFFSPDQDASDAPRAPEVAQQARSDWDAAVIGPLDTHVRDVFLSPGDYHTIVVEGDGSTDLDAYLLDEFGNEIDSDTDLTDFCIVGFEPSRPGIFRLVIVNVGLRSNLYEVELD
jgi:hypothetical protein